MEGVQKKEAEIAQKVDSRTLSLRPLLWRVLAWSPFSFSVALPVVPAEKSVKLRLACVAMLAQVAPPTTSVFPPMPSLQRLFVVAPVPGCSACKKLAQARTNSMALRTAAAIARI